MNKRIELEDERLEHFHLQEIKKESNKEEVFKKILKKKKKKKQIN